MSNNEKQLEAALQGHTPGPWRYAFDAHAHYGRFESVAPDLPYNDPVVLAVREDWTGYLDSPEGSANARLIAAAPEMLEALWLALGCLEAVADGRLADVKDKIGETANIVEEAIAKAITA